MAGGLPTIKGPQLVKLLKADGWQEKGKNSEGVAIVKKIGDRAKVVTIPTKHKNKDLPIGTLRAILGPKQTGLGRAGFLKLVQKYGIK